MGGVKGEPAVTIPAQVDELIVMFPALAKALTRDAGRADGPVHGTMVTSAGVVNADVLHVILTLQAEIPAAYHDACTVVREKPSPLAPEGSLTQLPRLGSRMHDLGLAGQERALADVVARWVLAVKRVLGLRTPDIPVGYLCPLCEAGELRAVGAEGFLRPARHGVLVVEWQHAGVICCGQCEATWTVTQWPHLGRLLGSQSSPTPARSRT